MGQLCILDIPGGLQNIVDHSNLPDKGPIQCRTPDFWQGIYDGDLQYRFLVSVHFHNIVFLFETHTEFVFHPCKKINNKKAHYNFTILWHQ